MQAPVHHRMLPSFSSSPSDLFSCMHAQVRQLLVIEEGIMISMIELASDAPGKDWGRTGYYLAFFPHRDFSTDQTIELVLF